MDVSQLCIDPSNTSDDDRETKPPSFNLDSRISISSINNDSSSNHIHNSSPNANINNNSHEYNNNNSYSTTTPTTPFTNINNGNQGDRNRIQQQRQTILKNVIDRCKLLQNSLSQYRDQPLTEALRSTLLDQVYCATVSMLESLAILEKDTPLEEEGGGEYNNMDLDNSASINTTTNASSSHHYPDSINEESKQEYSMIRQARNITETTRPKYRRRSKRSMAGQRCHSCNTTETPEWRRGPDGARTLCNACGLHYSKLLRKKSLTVQTHNYLLDQQSEERKVPRIIQYPIVHMPAPNSNNNISNSNSISSSNNNNNNNNNSGSYSVMRLPSISTSNTSPPASSSSHAMIYELSESELASIQTDSSWRQS